MECVNDAHVNPNIASTYAHHLCIADPPRPASSDIIIPPPLCHHTTVSPSTINVNRIPRPNARNESLSEQITAGQSFVEGGFKVGGEKGRSWDDFPN